LGSLADVIKIIRVIWGIAITRVIRVRFPLGDRLRRLGSWRLGRSGMAE
jgi:hypothetical protein